MGFLLYFLMLALVLVSVAFFTLMERKVLGYIHIRLGPNRVGPIGILQPLGDAAKLFTKETFQNSYSFKSFYTMSPLFGLFLMMILWAMYPISGGVFFLPLAFFFMFAVIGLTVYFLMYSGWAGGSKYGLLGSYRSSAQSISYEVVLIFLSILVFYFLGSYAVEAYLLYVGGVYMFFIFIYLFVVWMLSLLAESMRSPFDFSEGESELVSGFNTEYSGGLFSLIFIGEYGFMLFFSMLGVYFFLGSFLFSLKILFFVYFYIWVRGSFPRLRYDKLMSMCWKFILPTILSFFGFYFFLLMF